MRRERVGAYCPSPAPTFVVLIILLVGSVQFVQCQNVDDYSEFDNPELLPLFTQLVYGQISNMTTMLSAEFQNRSSFCVKDPDADWNQAFNYSFNLDFLASCIQKTKVQWFEFPQQEILPGDVHICRNKVLLHLDGLVVLVKISRVNLKNSQNIPTRTHDCQACCEGFFCPRGITCMIHPPVQVPMASLKDFKDHDPLLNIAYTMKSLREIGFRFSKLKDVIAMQLFDTRINQQGVNRCITTCFRQLLVDATACPLGSYCPLARVNKTTGVCEPYLYQLPPGQPNHTCGGANIWADVGSSGEVFCSSGSYCPTTTQKFPAVTGIIAGWVLHLRKILEVYLPSTSSYAMEITLLLLITYLAGCFKLASCNPNTANQNIHAYGAMLIAALSTLLLIIYNCSGQVLTTRERRQAKTREAAARSARETTRARESGKLQKMLPRDVQLDCKLICLAHFLCFRGISAFICGSKGKEKEPSELAKMMHVLDDDLDSFERFNLENGDKNSKKHMPKGKRYTHIAKFLSTHMLNLRKRSSATGKQGPYLFRSVSLENYAWTHTAVMGPSGAGKTTFISALAGKAIGCRMAGLILINGVNESIHSYKKIMGFVPQDDIVHGNLTVEENLWFSARCRYC
ncbi:ABC transporter G family member 24 [Vitis vinifera]|uniref:ABC transporter G family member 24 n=1 Tax=Vitis vinifera TaxID=29760 RepID=A0A438CWF9_VITVI|nr:ABC transporter G family member 24 [Vitis vinifera]